MTFDPRTIQASLVENLADASQFWEWITSGHELIAFDIETDGLNWYDGKIRLAQFGNLTSGWAIPYEWYPRLVREALEFLKAKGTLITGHNIGGFDLTWIRRHSGFVPDWSKVHDTMLLCGLIDSAGSKALKDNAAAYVHPVAKIGQEMLDADKAKYGFDWSNVPVQLPSYWFYGVMDCVLAANLLMELLPVATNVGVMQAYETERHTEKVLHQVSFNGMLADQEHCHRQMDILTSRIQEIETRVWKEYGLENIGSGPQLSQVFQNTGVKLTVKTPAGAWAMNKDALTVIAAENPDHHLVGLVTEYRKAQKYLGTYYSNVLASVRSDGRCHPSYKQMSARTLRMSATDPPIQTWPRANTDPEPRNAFISADGCSFISADQSNIEARLFSILAPDYGMQQVIREGRDMHCWIAGMMYNGGVPIEKKDPRRDRAKNSFFATIYGTGAETLAGTAGISVEEAKTTLTLIKRSFPSIVAHAKAMTAEAVIRENDTGRAGIRLLDGRLLRDHPNTDKYYQYANYSIQGSARMILAQRLNAMDNAGIMDRAVAVIHDEVVFEVPDDEVEEYTEAISEYFPDHETFELPMPVGVGKPCKRWGDAEH